MSVNPIDGASIKHYWSWFPTYDTSVTSFNRKLKAKTDGLYTWIDTHTYMMKTGWCTKDDGLQVKVSTKDGKFSLDKKSLKTKKDTEDISYNYEIMFKYKDRKG